MATQISPTEQMDVLATIGACLVLVQSVETAIRVCMTWVLQKPGSTAQSLLAQVEKERTRTLGYFLNEIRVRVNVDPNFERALSTFLYRRNMFVHDLSEVPGWDLNTTAGCKVARRWLREFRQLSDIVLGMFTALSREWVKQTGQDFPDHPVLQEIDKKYGPFVNSIFTAKCEESK